IAYTERVHRAFWGEAVEQLTLAERIPGDNMSTATRVTFDEFMRMQETAEAICYELDEGELLVAPSPALRHKEIHEALRTFSRTRRLGHVTSETDFLLAPDTVRRPMSRFSLPLIFSALSSAPKGLILAIQVFDLGRHDFSH